MAYDADNWISTAEIPTGSALGAIGAGLHPFGRAIRKLNFWGKKYTGFSIKEKAMLKAARL